MSIENEAEYYATLLRVERLMRAKKGTVDGAELAELARKIESYESSEYVGFITGEDDRRVDVRKLIKLTRFRTWVNRMKSRLFK